MFWRTFVRDREEWEFRIVWSCEDAYRRREREGRMIALIMRLWPVELCLNRLVSGERKPAKVLALRRRKDA